MYDSPFMRNPHQTSIISDSVGGVIIVSWIGNRLSASATYAQRIDSEGNSLWGNSGVTVYSLKHSPTLPILAAVVIIIAILTLVGVVFRKRLARILIVILPILMGITGLFGETLLVSRSWNVADTPLNVLSVLLIPIVGVITGTIGTIKALPYEMASYYGSSNLSSSNRYNYLSILSLSINQMK
ncbi:hypothetical protein ACFLTP_03210 [Chloroflexota bacterium]